MKLVITILYFCLSLILYSQEIKVTKTDADNLYRDIEFMFPDEAKQDEMRILIVFTTKDKYIIINNSVACNWKDIEVLTQGKLLRRREAFFELK